MYFNNQCALCDIFSIKSYFQSGKTFFISFKDIGCEQSQYEKYGGLKFPPLKSLIDLHVLYPAENVLAALYMGKVFTASLTMMGNIEGKGGEVFKTPMKWLSAVKGGEVVKKAQAYREAS